ncbi:flagellar export chaperone FliS [Polynucleobacter sp. AP-Jannik-300A-C4]|uniref:flagellar export chaperone FliS n=1 Tax=Polynucleobacter sp. AP-Jannik-300A-C4 TaxID=2576928 RepID=UPI0020421398|nr:flagellar export chaperone FliS [Polynucleobacter sp. AP-Jannik-300A-C4]
MNKSARAYAANEVLTGVNGSDAGQLIVLVYERVFDHLKLAKNALDNGEYGIESFTKAHDLIQQGLLACLDYEGGGEVALSLGAVYEWTLREILSARLNKSPEKVQEILDVLWPLYEAWLVLAPKDEIVHLVSTSSVEVNISQATHY